MQIMSKVARTKETVLFLHADAKVSMAVNRSCPVCAFLVHKPIPRQVSGSTGAIGTEPDPCDL